MGDLTEFVPEVSPTVQAIYDLHQQREEDGRPPRGYLGGSVLGADCDRFLWYTFRGCVPRGVDAKPGDHPGRLYRLFQTGHLMEDRFVEELRGIGCEVVQFDEARGLDKRGRPQQILVSLLAGHLRGHLDGAALGVPEAPKTWHVLEFKTHNEKSFARLKAKGLKEAKSEHWAQCQVYMGGTRMTRALYLAVNKNTDELYVERVRYDATAYQNLIDRGARVIRATQPPQRITERPDDWRCQFCRAKPLCFGLDETRAVALPAKTCRTCCHATAVTDGDGGWTCAKFGAIDDTTVGAECPHHLLLPGLVPFAEAVDAGEDWIAFESQNGDRWRHGPGGWSTDELISGRGPLDGPKEESVPFDVPEPASLIDAYPWQESERVWDGPAGQLAAALEERVLPIERLNAIEPKRSEITEEVSAVEYALPAGDFLIVSYQRDDYAAIWRGKA